MSLKIIWAVIRKDYLIERKTKEIFSSMLMYSLSVLIIFNFALGAFTDSVEPYSGGILWIAFTFSATLGMNRLFSHEQENGVMQALAMLPCDKGLIFLGKCASMLCWLTLTEWLIILLYCVLFDITVWSQAPALILAVFLGSLGYVAAGTLLSAVTVNTRMKENLLPLILFPVTIPLIISAVEATQSVITQPSSGLSGQWIGIMAAFDVIILTAAYLLYGYIFEE